MSVDHKGKKSLELAEAILKDYGYTMERNGEMEEAEINKGGFIACNFTPRQMLDELFSMTGHKA